MMRTSALLLLLVGAARAGRAPLVQAAGDGKVDVIKSLLKRSAVAIGLVSLSRAVPPPCTRFIPDPPRYSVPLCLRRLRDGRARPQVDIEGTDEYGRTALMKAAERGQGHSIFALAAAARSLPLPHPPTRPLTMPPPPHGPAPTRRRVLIPACQSCKRHAIRARCSVPRLRKGPRAGEIDAKLAQNLGQLQHFTAVFPQECMGQRASFGPS
jgi:hypothetical protein